MCAISRTVKQPERERGRCICRHLQFGLVHLQFGQTNGRIQNHALTHPNSKFENIIWSIIIKTDIFIASDSNVRTHVPDLHLICPHRGVSVRWVFACTAGLCSICIIFFFGFKFNSLRKHPTWWWWWHDAQSSYGRLPSGPAIKYPRALVNALFPYCLFSHEQAASRERAVSHGIWFGVRNVVAHIKSATRHGEMLN